MSKEVTCPICLNILYRPVVLPCNHEFCRECISDAVDKISYQCPICRYRLSNWLRRVKDINSAVDEARQTELRHLFPAYYKDKDLGVSPRLSRSEVELLRSIKCSESHEPVPSARGEIYSEYLTELERTSRLRAIEEEENEQASLALAFQLLSEGDCVADLDQTLINERPKSPQPTNYRKNQLSEDSRPLHASSSNTPKVKSKKDNRKLTRSKTILEYAVDKRGNSVHENMDPEPLIDQVSIDEQFARRLQAEYQKLSPAPRSSPSSSSSSSTRGRRRTCR
ncbi:unnamed protein product [Calicophoron daubneyi]|uniref:RING-type E3 ubiquitin transferase n=1 Tax=Calicophoron daubneyi TaxID=300641 RepID=A0AAV2TD47_CALDB